MVFARIRELVVRAHGVGMRLRSVSFEEEKTFLETHENPFFGHAKDGAKDGLREKRPPETSFQK